MSDEERKPWDRQEGESAKWFSRFDRFRSMKPWERSVVAAYEVENSDKQRQTATKIPGHWHKAARDWKWEERAANWDQHRLDERDKQIQAEEAEILRVGYAVKHERMKSLNEVAGLLQREVFDDNKRWLDDVKAVGIEAHHLKQFNDALIREYRATLDDIAKEKGERVRKQEVTGKDGGPIEVEYEVAFGGSAPQEEKSGE